MNFYFLVEGRSTEKKLYGAWVRHAFPHMKPCDRLDDLQGDRYLILSGNGYPQLLKSIKTVMEEVRAHPNIDHLFICLDAEDETPHQRRQQVMDFIDKLSLNDLLPAQFSIIIQNCCIETWLLGHRKMLKRNPESRELRELKTHHDVSLQDPEELNKTGDFAGTNAQFHMHYLREMFAEQGLAYSKTRPGPVKELSYWQELVARHRETNHLPSLGTLLQSWQGLGGVF